MKTIVIMYEHIAREYETCLRLKERLTAAGDVQAYLLSIHFQVKDLYRIAARGIIDVLAMPYVYKEKSLVDILPLLERGRIRIVLNLRHEQIGALYNEHRLYPRDDFSKSRIYHAAWSETYKAIMIEKGIDPHHIPVTQNPRSDLLYAAMHGDCCRDRNEVAAAYGLNPAKKWILFCESGAHRSEERIRKLLSQGYNEADLRAYNDVNDRDMQATEAQLNTLSATFLARYEIIYRPHPGTEVNVPLPPTVKAIGAESIYFWLQYVDTVISRFSTVLFEAEATGLRVFRFAPYPADRRFLTYGLEYVPAIENLEQLCDNKPYVNPCPFENYIGQVDGHAVEKLAGTILALADGDDHPFEGYRPDPALRCRKAARHSKLSNTFARFAYRSGCGFLKKKSRSLSVFARDIPPEWKHES